MLIISPGGKGVLQNYAVKVAGEDPQASWGPLVEAIKKMDHGTLACKVEAWLLPSHDEPSLAVCVIVNILEYRSLQCGHPSHHM